MARVWNPDSMARTAPPRASIPSISARASRSIRSVISSSATAPPTGSTVMGTPLSYAMICCVRSATVAASSLGSESASSKEFVWSDCAPPSTAASAWIATRAMLLWGCCAVRVETAVCA